MTAKDLRLKQQSILEHVGGTGSASEHTSLYPILLHLLGNQSMDGRHRAFPMELGQDSCYRWTSQQPTVHDLSTALV